MDTGVWLTFALAALVIAIIPGPGVLSTVAFAVSSGRRTALAAVAGMAVGSACAMTLSLIGVGAILSTSAIAFMLLKWAGAIYLIGLGIYALLRSGAAKQNEPTGPATPRTAFLSNATIGLLHPKTIMFFVAFAPQFIIADAPYLPQAAILVGTFTMVAAMSDTIYALTAARAASMLRAPAARRWTRRAGGGALVVAGAAMAATRQ